MTKLTVSAPTEPLTSVEFRGAVGQFATGITVVSTLDAEGKPYGMTASSFCSLSLDPPLIQWSISTKSFSFPIFNQAAHFAVNILAADQEEVSRNFCKPINRFSTVAIAQGLHGLPLIEGSLAWLECKLEERLIGGDHTIFIGRVLRSKVFDKTPLLHWRGGYVPVEPDMVA
ncbi:MULTISPECIES: flavin reductase family protein [unclassified Pseudomonas]|uniref:flavin reductase family protein n=1 Tax=unclassified Pseudomonas TaxID=196821 RepID=UPI0008718B70|nr:MULTISPECIES: flavin reductase family protein [unclassified Pseudomonas]SCW56804.1 NADH-FMN oxidoreductase RutF, flavin reductase (DIM6/NTAB) family [Pseudomonas sp. NFACC56-3]SFK30674.1 NADH-FMN oxidoreductase RutF, flavin reductase (DIM6/NTAB) family [Pseudomonas sp. NFACC52]